ncbi:GNAT superfamily N-acetyltransferase [Kribbella aluminosa]|uniref:GNAT superfamily N-acetyltransferase n=1 Tax=Kribbella aluminosa TaxID=416017 RepID=A0ABS4UMA9_9ACTN|nr:GNAT family N-acetyltransferase [Kribbella aluminosa]MBP2352750.1 GNAT superfamily N-acetyltransferase [Kribbella aluminosa]
MTITLIPLTDPDYRPFSRRIAWLAAHGDGTPAGSAFLRLDSRGTHAHLADFELTVHPAERRHGIGTLLLRAVAGSARDHDIRTLITDVDAGSAGDRFLQQQGFGIGLTLVYARLDLAHRTPDVPAVPGYRLVSWEGVAPDDLVQTFTDARAGMADAPTGSISAGADVWDVDRTRHAARLIEQRGDHLSVVAALDRAGRMAGFTEVVVPGDGKGDGQLYGTAVLPEHRGRGLALWMKAAQIHEVRHRFPDLDGLLTDTVDTNTPMRRTNDRLGYRPQRQVHRRKLDLIDPGSSAPLLL